ncbi:MAG TPA: SpoIIE family protein phosphatase [Terracidiphilus sp.]|nr:SpoIIE family protein phosphatase [Terracidiphilus sp.]
MFLWLFALGWVAAVGLPAQTLAHPESATPMTHVHLGQSVVALNGPWKFHIGDSPVDARTGERVWAEPGFDDSRWDTVDLTAQSGSYDPIVGFTGYVKGWTAKGYPGVTGYGWYRIRVSLESHTHESLALAGPSNVDDGYQIYVNGNVLGSFGDFSHSTPRIYYTQPRIFPLPAAMGAGGEGTETLVLAIRFWMAPSSPYFAPDTGGMHTPPLIGDARTVEAVNQLSWLELIRAYAPRPISGALYLFVAIIAFSLVLFDRSDRVYLWIGGVFLLLAAQNAIATLGTLTGWLDAVKVSTILDVTLAPLTFAGWAMVFWIWFKLRSPAWIPRAIGGLTLLLMVSDILGGDTFVGILPVPVMTGFHTLSLILRLAFLVMLLGIIALGFRRNRLDGWLVLPTVFFIGVTEFYRELRAGHLRLTWFPFGIQITANDLANLLLILTLSALLLRRLLISIREQRRLALDVKQAQEVQQVILPQARLAVADLVVESEYRPDRQVGGDFFQIIPDPGDKSLLIVAGDVAGKGLKAGMLVALLVGAIRSTVESESEPEMILAALNRRLIGRGDAHATCLALRIGWDGAVKVANAGHIPPYVNGQAIELQGSLPLGLTEQEEFSSASVPLGDGDRLIVMSDGVAEAMDAAGHLFGFDRVLELLRGDVTAAEIAEAAQRFGQQDDISVISVTRGKTSEAAVALVLEGVAS